MINASLFAHIQNDAFLSGTYGLEGHRFMDTIRYLKKYFATIPQSPYSLELMQNTQYLVEIEQCLVAHFGGGSSPQTLEQIATRIANDLSGLCQGEKLLLPGGWLDANAGHAMVYQFSKEADGFRFTVFNSGDGLEYHAKKSMAHKELYNPTKAWFIPNSALATREVTYFIERLLQALVPQARQGGKGMTAEVLYEEIFPSIHFIDGEEIDVNQGFPEHGYTGGQLSGTCAQRCLHQMWKLHSQSEAVYQRAVFQFKCYALDEYVQATCVDHTQVFNQAVANQIELAIDNNLKILNIPDLFVADELDHYFAHLTQIKQTVSAKRVPAKSPAPNQNDNIPTNTLRNVPLMTQKPDFTNSYHKTVISVPIKLKNGKNLLENLAKVLDGIQRLPDNPSKHLHLEQLILSLPLNQVSIPFDSFYSELSTLEEYLEFQYKIHEIQDLLNDLRKTWLKDAESAKFNYLVLSVLALQIDTQEFIARANNLPSFMKATNGMMSSFIHPRSPFGATNHPIYDQRICHLADRFFMQPKVNNEDYQLYLKNILLTEPKLNQKLTKLYAERYGQNTSILHEEIRRKGLQVLYLISQYLTHQEQLSWEFTPIIKKIESHHKYEIRLSEAIAPFFITPRGLRYIHVYWMLDDVYVFSALNFGETNKELLKQIMTHKYLLKKSSLCNALHADLPKLYDDRLKARTANHIQLEQVRDKAQQVTQADIVARDFYHLRSDPFLQIALTIDYFRRNIDTDEDRQIYLEANLFQPGLLFTAMLQGHFFDQFNQLLADSKRNFNPNSQYTRNSLNFLRLDFLVSRYMAQMQPVRNRLEVSLFLRQEGISRLEQIHEDLKKQLVHCHDPEVRYVVQQYLFMTIMAQIESGANVNTLFAPAFQAYFYLMGHTNPLIHKDTSHIMDVDYTCEQFKVLAGKQKETVLRQVVTDTLIRTTAAINFKLSGRFPYYKISSPEEKKSTRGVDVARGTIFVGGLSQGGVPLTIMHHPLIKQLGLQDVRECLMNAGGTFMILQHNNAELFLFYKENCLTIQKDWTVAGRTEKYELQALTLDHLAHYANRRLMALEADLPKPMMDGSMNYWKRVSNSPEPVGLLTCYNVPAYSVTGTVFKQLDEQGADTLLRLTQRMDKWRGLLNHFESNHFLLAFEHAHTHQYSFKLPRYDLNFIVNEQVNALVLQETGEQVLDCPSPIDPAVAGLVLQKNQGEQRYLVPLARFYPAQIGLEQSDFYPLIHDINGTIEEAVNEDYWKTHPPLCKPMWHYNTGTRRYYSFRLHEGEPIADKPTDALYLAYLYLASNQTQKAWNLLEECTTRFGGLQGSPGGIVCIFWICKELPHIFQDHTKSNLIQKEAIRNTPAYVACQLKAMSLLTEFLYDYDPAQADNQVTLETRSFLKDTANAQRNLLESRRIDYFLITMTREVYQTYTRYMAMGRHLEHGYHLSKMERKNLLDFYLEGNPHQKSLGALGYEWMQLHLDELIEEQTALLAQSHAGLLPPADAKRLKEIEAHMQRLTPVMAKSTELERVALNLRVPVTSQSLRSMPFYNEEEIKVDDAEEQRSIGVLSSNMSDDDFMSHFPVYLNIVRFGNNASVHSLLGFCTKTLRANRHIRFEDHVSLIPLLSMILYKIANNRASFAHDLSAYRLENFEKLMKITSAYNVPALHVYQAKDIHKDILASPQDIIARQIRRTHQPINAFVIPQNSLIKQTCIDEKLHLSLNDQTMEFFHALKQRYQEVEEKLDGAQDAFSQRLTHDVHESFRVEREVGEEQRAAEKAKIELAQELLSHRELVAKLHGAASHSVAEIEIETEHLWSEALACANQGPDSSEQKRQWAIARESGAREKLKKADLLVLYTRADQTDFIERTGLNAQKIHELYHLIHSALVSGIRLHAAKKIANIMDAAAQTPDANQVVQVLDVLTRAEIPGLNTPAVVLLQHEEEILLHKRQSSALNALLAPSKSGKGFNEVVEKVIMGGGKSKVLIPILVEAKARGDNLVIVEVPHALLTTSYEDANRGSQRLYGKRAYRFEFNRDHDCSPEALERIYQRFTKIMTNKCYLMTAGESMQSLELTYIELMLSQNNDAIAQAQIDWCERIINLVRHYGDSIIDEVHQGLAIKKKLNYTSGKSVSISPSLAKNATDFFHLIDIELIQGKYALGQEFDWTAFKNTLAQKLIDEGTSPLRLFMDTAILKFGLVIKEEIFAYLTQNTKRMSQAILQASQEDKDALAFFKEEITKVVSKTLSSRHNEHYGPSMRANLSPIERTLAIPYAGNNNANERNRFGNVLRAINLTIQMMLIQGLSKELVLEQISIWQALARQELFQNKDVTHLDETSTANGFNLLVSPQLGLSLSQIDVSNKQQFECLYACLKNNKALIFELLQEHSLKQIHFDAQIIHSDALNHVDLYRSVQGLSGTPYNHTMYHKRLAYNKAASLGTDGYVIAVIKDKRTEISCVDYHNASQFIEAALSGLKAGKKRVRAIIDICATFLGVSNFFVAQELAQFLNRIPNQTIQHVLYFNKDQVLSAINIQKPDAPIILATSDEYEISRLLGSGPNERFTYYDQVHTLGIDIKQDETAHALVLVDGKTSLQAFLQGSMRMRGLSQNQSIEISVPTALQGKNYEELIEQFEKVDRDNLMADNLSAVQLQMTNLIRRKCLTIIQDLPSSEIQEKRRLAQVFKPFLVDTPSTDLFKLYGGIDTAQNTQMILAQHQKQVLFVWNNCLVTGDLSRNLGVEIEEGLQEFIDAALPHCLEEYVVAADDAFDSEVEIQTELQMEQQKEQMVLNESYDPQLVEKPQIPWPNSVSSLYSSENELNGHTLFLNELCSFGQKMQIELFSRELRVSKNYATVYEGQTSYLNAFLKPVFVVWYHMQQGVLHATVVTNQDAEELEAILRQEKTPDSWLATTLDTLITGNRPAEVLNDQLYQILREQIRFFNGELTTLINQDTPLHWLKEQTTEKLNFFEQSLLLYRPGSNVSFQHIKSVLNQVNAAGIRYIAQHPFDDLSTYEWNTLYPQIVPTQTAEYKKVAQAFVSINQNWHSNDLVLIDLQRQFHLPVNSLGYVNQHLEYLKIFKRILNILLDLSPHNSLSVRLKHEEVALLRASLGMSVEELEEKGDDAFRAQEGYGDLDILLMLRFHQAIKGKPSVEQAFDQAIVTTAASAEGLKLILSKVPDRTEDLIGKILAHPLCDASVIDEILGLSADRINSYSRVQTVLDKLAMNPAAVRQLLGRLIDRCNWEGGDLWQGCFTAACQFIKQNGLFQEMKNTLLESKENMHLNFILLDFFGKELVQYIPFEEMIEAAGQHNVSVLLNVDKTGELNEALLRQLAFKVERSEHIDTLLAHTNMSSVVAEDLLQKEHYSGKIGRWEWLTQDQLLFVLNKTRDYESVHKALVHTHLEEKSRNDWLAHHMQRSKLAEHAMDHKEKILAALDMLKIKAFKHVIKACTDPTYTPVARTSFELYHELHRQVEAHFNSPDPDVPALKANCQRAIEAAEPVLNQHRGYKQTLWTILNVIIAYLCFRPTTINGGRWHFFAVNTDSMNVVNQVSHIIGCD